MASIPNKIFAASAISTCVGIAFYIRERRGGKKYPYKTPDAINKVVIVTGASSGIGAATAKELALRKAHVVLACRDMEQCQRQKDNLKFYMKNPNIECMQLDLSDFNSIRKFAEKIKTEYKRLDVIVNNAGVLALEQPRRLTAQNIELHLGVNHMGHFLLTTELLPLLKSSAPSRIVNVTCLAYKKGVINKEDLNMKNMLTTDFDPMKAYEASKLANLLFTKELSSRLEGSGVTANVVDPGVVNTRLMRHTSFYNSYFSFILLKPFLWMFLKNDKQGCQTVLYAAISPKLQSVSGKLLRDFEEVDPELSEEQAERGLAKWLWDVSVKWTSAA